MNMPPQDPYGPAQGHPQQPGPPPPFPRQPGPHGYPPRPGPQAYPQHAGGPAYPPNTGPRKKSKVPMILGIVLASIVVVVALVVVLVMTAFRAPMLAAEQTRDLASSGLTVGGTKVANPKETSAEKLFSGSDSCSRPSRESLTSASPVYTASGGDSVIIVGRYSDSSGAETGYKTMTEALKDCTASNYRITQPTFNRASINGASYQTFKLTRNPGSSQSGREILIIHYGNTMVIATADSMGEPKTTVEQYVSRYKETAGR